MVTVGAIEATLRLHDELTPALRNATRAAKELGRAMRQVRRAYGRLPKSVRVHRRRTKAAKRRG